MGTSLSQSLTKNASLQTYYTIRFLVDRARVDDAFRAYGYMRWVDDMLDDRMETPAERHAFLRRQRDLLESCYQGAPPGDANLQESILVDLVGQDPDRNSGLHAYLANMMLVMEFDVRRRGRLISQAELNQYTYWLASAVTEAMHYFIGHCCATPHDETRYLAVSAAHVCHMLRDSYDDLPAGYINIPREALEAHAIQPQDFHSDGYRAWVKHRVLLARHYFQTGKSYLRRVESPRCRLAGFAYAARFEWLLDTLEREGYSLRPDYSDRKSAGAVLKMAYQALSSLAVRRGGETLPRAVEKQIPRKL